MQEEEILIPIKEEDPLLKNYLMLYQAILFSDYDDGQDYVVCVYDTVENDRLVAVFNNDKTCANFFNTSKITIQAMRNRNQLIKYRFKTERFECGTTSTKTEYYKIMNDINNKKTFRYFQKYNGYKKIF